MRDSASIANASRRFRPILGTADALTRSGDLALIRATALRGAILDHAGSMRTDWTTSAATTKPIAAPAVQIFYRGPDLDQFAEFRSTDERLLPVPLHVESFTATNADRQQGCDKRHRAVPDPAAATPRPDARSRMHACRRPTSASGRVPQAA